MGGGELGAALDVRIKHRTCWINRVVLRSTICYLGGGGRKLGAVLGVIKHLPKATEVGTETTGGGVGERRGGEGADRSDNGRAKRGRKKGGGGISGYS